MSAFTFTIGGDSVAPGAYPGVFVRVAPFDENPDYGEAIKLVWKITDGKCAGQEIPRVVSKKTGPKANLPKFAQMLKGEALANGERFDFSDYYRVRGTVVVEATESGGSRVASFIREDLTNGEDA
jgi:hypothetical protein